MLVEKSVIRRDQDVRKIRRGKLSDQFCEVLDRIFRGLWQLVFSLQLVANRVDMVVVNVNHVVVSEELFAFVDPHVLNILGLQGLRTIPGAPSREQLLASVQALGAFAT